MTEIIREIRIKTACAKNKTNKMRSNPTKAPTRSQRKIMSACTRLNVTTCLYLRPNDSVRSLITLIAVDVKTETPQRKKTKYFSYKISDFKEFFAEVHYFFAKKRHCKQWLCYHSNKKIGDCQTKVSLEDKSKSLCVEQEGLERCPMTQS